MKIKSQLTRADGGGGIISAGPSAEDDRLVEISFSSEASYKRAGMDGPFLEVLGHGPDEVDLSRLESGAAPLLTDHWPNVNHQAGVVERAWIEGGKGRAVVRFATTPAADDLLTKVRDGIVTCVSVGYRILSAIRDGEDAEGVPIVRVKRWQPYEISFVSIPADPSVGLGRAAEDAPEITLTEVQTKEAEMPKDVPNPTPTNPTPDATPASAISPADAVRAFRQADRAVDQMAARFDLPEDMVTTVKDELADGQRDIAEIMLSFRETALDHVENRNVDESQTNAQQTRIGMQEEHLQEWSLMNVIRYLSNPHSSAAQKAAGFEIECSRAVEEKLGREANGLFIPSEVLIDPNYARAQNTQTAAAGGALVPTTHMAGSFIEMLRERMIISRLGARVLDGLHGNIDIPKRLSGATLYWLDEDEDVTDSESAFGTITMSPHTAGMAVPITRRMMQNGSPSIEALVRDDLLNGIAIGTDRVALIGDPSPNAPQGLRDYILGNVQTWATGAGNNPDFADMVGQETRVIENLALMGDLAYVYGPALSGYLKTTPRFAGGEIPIELDGKVNGYRREVATQMAGFARESIFGNFNDLILGYWSGFDLKVDDATKAASGGRVLRAFVDMDTGVRHNESFDIANS